jgi:hypothetical protein
MENFKSLPFTRPTIIAAASLLEGKYHANFDMMALRVGLDQLMQSNSGASLKSKSVLLAQTVLRMPNTIVETLEGPVMLCEAVVREAVQLVEREAYSPNPSQVAFERALARDGYVIAWEEGVVAPWLRRALPSELDLPATDDEVRTILKEFNFDTPIGHLTQAIDSHTQGRWAAANSQLRTFLESLFDELSSRLFGTEASQLATSENRRALLASKGFVSVARNEWSQDGKSFIPGLFKMLHTEGSHPGLSDEDHSTLRLHLALVTARAFLRRAKYLT